jgi:hypothetical protein
MFCCGAASTLIHVMKTRVLHLSRRERNKVQNHTDRPWVRGEEAQSVVLCERAKINVLKTTVERAHFFLFSPEAFLVKRELDICVWTILRETAAADALWAHQSGTARAIPVLSAELCMCSARAARKSNSIHLSCKKNKINAAAARSWEKNGHPENIKPRMWKHNEPPCIWTLPCSARRRWNRISRVLEFFAPTELNRKNIGLPDRALRPQMYGKGQLSFFAV